MSRQSVNPHLNMGAVSAAQAFLLSKIPDRLLYKQIRLSLFRI